MSKNYYEILGVSQDASKDEIKRAFRQKAREFHPDVNKAPDAAEKFKEIGKAYETLSNEEKRSLYDRYGEEGLNSAGYSGGPFDAGFGNLNDIFETFFGSGFGGFGGFDGFGGRTNPNAPQQGSDLRYDLELTFKEAVFGVEKELKITHSEQCDECHGTGAADGAEPTVCPVCGGRGQVQQTIRTPLGHMTQVTSCQRCGGTGQVISKPCSKCKGRGVIEKSKTITVKIPAGVDTHSKIRVANEGDAGKNGGKSGDLYIVIYVDEDEKFQRDGYNVYANLEISFPQATLGDTIEVETLNGKKLLQIPQGAQYDQMVVLKNEGVPYLGKSDSRGDLVYILKVTTPTKLTEPEKELYKSLYDIYKNKKDGKDGILGKLKNSLNR